MGMVYILRYIDGSAAVGEIRFFLSLFVYKAGR